MLFNSIEFAIFLPLVFLLYWFVFNRNLKKQNFFIVAVSYLFYGWWDWRFLILIAFTSFCSWGSGLLIHQYREQKRKAKWINGLNIAVNLCILGVFKYYDFFATSFANLFLDGHTDGILLNFVLPVGISFYTFQALSYSIDVYREKLVPTNDPVQFFAFVSFFPQLVAGPIERATNLLPQFNAPRHDIFYYAHHHQHDAYKGFKSHQKNWDGSALASIKQLNYPMHASSIEKFDRFLQECKEENILVVFVYAPFYIKATQKISHLKEIHGTFGKLAKKYGCPILDYTYHPLSYDTCYFYNAQHLNSKGANIFTTQLAHDLDSLQLLTHN